MEYQGSSPDQASMQHTVGPIPSAHGQLWAHHWPTGQSDEKLQPAPSPPYSAASAAAHAGLIAESSSCTHRRVQEAGLACNTQQSQVRCTSAGSQSWEPSAVAPTSFLGLPVNVGLRSTDVVLRLCVMCHILIFYTRFGQ